MLSFVAKKENLPPKKRERERRRREKEEKREKEDKREDIDNKNPRLRCPRYEGGAAAVTDCTDGSQFGCRFGRQAGLTVPNFHWSLIGYFPTDQSVQPSDRI